MVSYAGGGTIHWVPANGTSWLSFENNDGDPFEISIDDGIYGTYPLFITTQSSYPGPASANLFALTLGEDSRTLIDTGIAIADTFSVNTSCLHDYTYARIAITDAPNPNIVQWTIFSDQVVDSTSTGPNTFSNQEGGTIVVLDTDDSNNNWSWTTAGGQISVPAATDSFEIASNMFGGYWNPFGYSTNGKQVLIDKDGGDLVVGLYFLSENNTSWIYMPNAWDRGVEKEYAKGLNNFAIMAYNDDPGVDAYYYMNYDIATGSFISGGYAVVPSGDFGIIAIGDRMSARVPVGGNQEFNCFTGAGIVQVTTPATHLLAYNDAAWSWDF
jgi:hypothetical protein